MKKISKDNPLDVKNLKASNGVDEENKDFSRSESHILQAKVIVEESMPNNNAPNKSPMPKENHLMDNHATNTTPTSLVRTSSEVSSYDQQASGSQDNRVSNNVRKQQK